jgi:hypothetical protein
MGICLALLVLLCPAGAGAQSAGGPAEQVMRELRAADRARMQRVRELEEWRMERQRLELLRDALEHEKRSVQEEAENLRAEIKELRERRERVQQARDRREALMRVLRTTAERLEAGLAKIARKGPPGLVPPAANQVPATSDARVKLSGQVARLRETGKRLENSAVDMASGQLQGELRTVHCLRLGGVAAWWMTLDGERVGRVQAGGDLPTLRPVDDEDEAAAIRRAFDIAWGRELPAWVTLPLGRTE